MFATPRSLYKAFAFSEGVTWTLLLGGLAIRAIFGAPQLALTIVGGIHGAVFLGYGVSAALVGVNNRWGFGRTVLAIALAIRYRATDQDLAPSRPPYRTLNRAAGSNAS